jgi:transcriptional regulator with XRE-family HTH domain
MMNFGFGMGNKTVKELRKNQGYTAAELAERIKVEPIEIKRIDHLKFKDVAEPLKSKLKPIFRGDDTDKMKWL